MLYEVITSALDVETERILWERIFSERSDATYLVVSHRKAALTHADHIIVLKDGTIEAEGTVDLLLETSQSFRELWYGENTEQDIITKNHSG